MPFATVKIQPGVKIEQTPTLLSANIVASQNIRWRGGLPEKIGGWSLFYPNPITGVSDGIVRAIWPWADDDSTSHLAIAGDNGVDAITNGVLLDISPSRILTDQAISAKTISVTMSSTVVTITDLELTGNLSTYVAVVFEEQVSIGGIILYGPYRVTTIISATQYTITAQSAAASTTSTWTTPKYTTVADSEVATVTLLNHGMSVGETWPVKTSTVVGGVRFSGFYTVQSVIDANNFTLVGPLAVVSQGPIGPALIIEYFGGNPPGGRFASPLSAPSWTLGNFGSFLIINPLDNPLFIWDPVGLSKSANMIVGISGSAPIAATGFFIAMPQEQIVAYGASTLGVQDPMLVRWSDAGSYSNWVDSASNESGTYRLTRGSKIIGGIQGPQQAVLWTDVGFWLMQYVGYPDVYGFFEIAQGCGLIAQKAATVAGTAIYWMGHGGIWVYANGAVQPVQCEVWDTIFQNNINSTYAYKIVAAANTPYHEVTWHYPSLASTGENDLYIRLNVLTGEWDFGSSGITAWADDNIFGSAISAMIDTNGTDGLIMQHETSENANGQALTWSFTTGFFSLTEGEDKVFVDYVIPDGKWQYFNQTSSTSATVNLTFYVQDYPNDPVQPAIALGPYAVTNATGAIEIRARGRYFSATISGNDTNSFFRLGGFRFRMAPDGRN